MSTRNPDNFDRRRPLIADRAGQLNGHPLAAGATVTVVDEESDEPRKITAELAARLWAGGTLSYADERYATPVESKEAYARRVTELEDLGGGWYLLRAPHLAEAEKIKGLEDAEKRRAEVISEGIELAPEVRQIGASPFTFTEEGSNGWYEVHGPGLDEPLRVRGKAAAEAKVAELTTAAAPVEGAITNVIPPPPPPGTDGEGEGETDGA